MDRTATVRLRLVTTMFESAAARSGQTVRGIGKEFTTASAQSTQAMQSIGRGAMIAGAVAAAGVGIAIRRFADFDQQMSNVKAATHETAANMNLLRAAALQAGADTVFSATEAADAVTQLAKAGVATKDILGGGLTGALSLAAAGELEVGQAAEIAATAMTQFKLEGKDIPHIADLLAAGAGKAQGEVADMALAMEYAGVPAAELGVSIEETAGTIALFAKNGIIGERSGTTLRSMIASLTSPSVKAADVMKDLGLQVFDAQGKFIGLEGVAGELQARLGEATDAEKSMALGIIFGNEALQGANVLTREGAAGVHLWTQEVNDQGYAASTAAIKLDNLKGDWEQFSGSLETALIKSGSAADGLLRTSVQTATSVVNAYGALPGPAQAGATALGATAAAALLAGGGFLYLAPKVAAARAQLALMPRTAAAASASLRGLAKAGAVVAASIAVGYGVKKLQDAVVDTVPGVDSLTASLLELNSAADLEAMGGQFDHIGAAVERLVHPSGLQKFDNFLSGTAAFTGVKATSLREAEDAMNGVSEALAGLVQSGNGDEAARIFGLVAEAAASQGQSVDDVRRAMPAYVEAVAAAGNASALAGDGGYVAADGFHSASEAAEDAADAVDDYKDALDTLNGVNITAMQAQLDLRDSFDDAKDAIKGHGKASRDEKKALLDLAGQINDTAAAYVEQTGAAASGDKVLRDSRPGFIRTARAMGLSKKAANELADAVIGIPPKKDVKVKLTGAEAATASASTLYNTLFGMPSSKTITVTTHYVTTGDRGSGGGGHADGGRLPLRLASGGRIPSWMGGPREDNVMIAPGIRASGGEYVVNAPATAANLGLIEMINAGRGRAFAAGGHYGGGSSGGGGVLRLHPDDRALLEAIASRPVQGDAYMDGEKVGRVLDRRTSDQLDSILRAG